MVENMQSPDRTRVDALNMSLTRDLIKSSKEARQEAIAQFSMRTSQIATNLYAILRYGSWNSSIDADSICDELEGTILQAFRESFGRDLFEGEDLK